MSRSCGPLIVALLCAGCASRPPVFKVVERGLDAGAVRDAMARSDELYREPRSAERVVRSYEEAVAGVSRLDGYSGLWRAARACAWLAERHPERVQRLRFASQGTSIAMAAVERCPDRPEPSYFHALNLGLLSQLEGRGLDRIGVMVERAEQVVALDERFDHAGGHRFLALLIDATKDNFFVAVGDLDDAIDHAERACELFPSYGHNRLVLARLLMEDEAFDRARAELLRVMASPVPEDESVEHAEWLAEATRLLEEIDKQAAEPG